MTLNARRAGFKQAGLSYLTLAVMMTVFFSSVGRINIPRAWMFFGATFIYLSLIMAALYRYRPELLVQRLRRKREGSKTWDDMLMRACNLTAMLVVPAVAGLDVGRFRWSEFGSFFAATGFVVFAFSSVLINWAMIENHQFY